MPIVSSSNDKLAILKDTFSDVLYQVCGSESWPKHQGKVDFWDPKNVWMNLIPAMVHDALCQHSVAFCIKNFNVYCKYVLDIYLCFMKNWHNEPPYFGNYIIMV